MTEKTFREAFGVLQQHAETLRDQAEPNIDDLLTIVQESVEAYGVCKERIDAVEAALKAALDGAGVGASAVTAAQPAMERAAPRAAGQPSKPTAPTSFDDMEDDIPF